MTTADNFLAAWATAYDLVCRPTCRLLSKMTAAAPHVPHVIGPWRRKSAFGSTLRRVHVQLRRAGKQVLETEMNCIRHVRDLGDTDLPCPLDY
jgi:hypothetical protein